MGDRITSMAPFERLMLIRMETLLMNKEATMSFVWHVFKALMKRLKLFKISFLSFNMEEMIEVFNALFPNFV